MSNLIADSSVPAPAAQQACYDDRGSTDPSPLTSPATWAAKNLRERLVQVAPASFGGGQHFGWYGVLDILPKAGDPSGAYAPGDPLVSQTCAGTGDVGAGHQWLSRDTDGLRSSIYATSFDQLFQSLAAAVAETVDDGCTFKLDLEVFENPKPENYIVLDVDGVDGPQRLESVPSAPQCADSGFVREGDILRLCPVTCAALEVAPTAEVQVRASCTLGPG